MKNLHRLEQLNQFRHTGLVQKIGVSVYTSEQIDDVLSKYDIDFIQLSLNLFDQCLIQSGTLKRLKQKR